MIKSTPSLNKTRVGFAVFVLAVAGVVGAAGAEEEAEFTSEAIQLIREKAEQGDAQMQTALGEIYYYGNSVPQNYAEAVKWYRRAAEQGFARSTKPTRHCL